MTNQKQIVEKYMEGFNESNHEKILSCLTDDVAWTMPGFFHLREKNSSITNRESCFEGRPVITTMRLVEEGNIVVAEGAVKSKFKNGDLLDAVFCDVFHFRDGKINHLTSYLMHNKQEVAQTFQDKFFPNLILPKQLNL
jgi:ketosteroid isomerase-like protein